jgi:hypothetical protein
MPLRRRALNTEGDLTMAVIDSRATLSNQVEANAGTALLSLGPGPWDGTAPGAFKGSSSGTLVGGDVASTFAGNLLDLQVAGATKFKVDASGNLYQPTSGGTPIKINRYEEITFQLLASSVSQTIFIADDNYVIAGVSVVVSVVGGSGATVAVEVNTGTQAPGSGTAQTGNQDLHSLVVNTVTPVALTATTAIASGNRVGLVFAGTLTGLVGNLTLQLQRT